jgi:hypothetical protein
VLCVVVSTFQDGFKSGRPSHSAEGPAEGESGAGCRRRKVLGRKYRVVIPDRFRLAAWFFDVSNIAQILSQTQNMVSST